MTDFTEQVAADLAAIIGDGGEMSVAATYTPKGGSPAALYGIPMPSNIETDTFSDGTSRIGRMTFVILTADVANPLPFDSISIAGQDWNVTAVRNSGCGKATLELTREVQTMRADANRIRNTGR